MLYTVTDTRQIDRMTPGGGTVSVYKVWLMTSRGATGSVEVPADKWNTDDLKPLLEEAAGRLDLAYNVSG